MQVYQMAVLAAVVACGVAQDPYTQGLVQGGTLALAATAVAGLGVIAIQNSRRPRYRQPYYAPGGYYAGGYNGPYQPQPYYPRRFRRQAAADDALLEAEFDKVLSRDKQECGLRLVCELEARTAAGEDVGEMGQLIIDGLFSSHPAPASEVTSARGRYQQAAFQGSQSDVKTCGELYSSCKFSSKTILALVHIARTARGQ